MSQLWGLEDGRVIDLIAANDLDAVPDGTPLLSIMGKPAVKGVDKIDTDTRGGFLAYGVITVDKSWEERMAVLGAALVEAAPPLIVRALSDDGEGPMAVAMRRLISCAGEKAAADGVKA
jgi:hypothetical protein